MGKRLLQLACLVPLGLIAPLYAMAAVPAGGDAIVLVADSRHQSGWVAWWINLYNESHLYFAIATVVVIPVLSLAVGLLTDLIMTRIGINLKSRVLAEH